MENTTPSTNNFLNWVEIKNFKSIKDLRLDCKRVNVFIGKPNVGKSNILEALGLLVSQPLFYKAKFFEKSLRYEKLKDLFYDKETGESIRIATNFQKVNLTKPNLTLQGEISYDFTIQSDQNRIELTEEGGVVKSTFTDDWAADNSIKKYDFGNLTRFENSFSDFLLPPIGSNLYSVIKRNKDLWAEFAKLFLKQQLELVLDDEKQELILQKKNEPYVIQYPYFSIADTFRRFMFYITAIESNKNSVIIFEEPEVHSFPPYTQEMAYRMIYDEDNQYFISTHSPYILHPFIEKMDYKDLNVFITYYKDYQTQVRALTEKELADILDFSTNVFFNLKRFEPDA